MNREEIVNANCVVDKIPMPYAPISKEEIYKGFKLALDDEPPHTRDFSRELGGMS